MVRILDAGSSLVTTPTLSRSKLLRAVLAVWVFAFFAGLASGVTHFDGDRVAQQAPIAPDAK